MSDQTDPKCECDHVASAHEHGKRCAGKHFVTAGNYYYDCFCTKCPHEVELEAVKAREEAAARENGWMRRVLSEIGWMHWMSFVEGPWYATGDFDELAFFRRLKDEQKAALAASEPSGDTDAVLREAGYDPEAVAARSRETAMKATYDEGYRAGVMAERARIAAGINALRGASEPPAEEGT